MLRLILHQIFPPSGSPAPGAAASAGAPAVPAAPGGPAPPSFRVSRVDGSAGPPKHLLPLALENLVHAIRRSPVSDVTAAMADLKRVAGSFGQVAAQLLNAPDPSGEGIWGSLARTRIDVLDKYLMLARMQCDMKATNFAGDNLMHLAARHNNAGLVRAVGEAGKALLGRATGSIGPYTQVTPLGVAVASGHPAIVRLFVLLGASLHEPCCIDGDKLPLTPLEFYAQLENRTPDMSDALRIPRTSRTQRNQHNGTTPA